MPCEHGFNQTLGDDIDEPPIGRGGVSVILNRQTEVSWGNFAGTFQNIFSRTDEFNYGERKIGEVIGIGGFAPQQEIVQRLGVGLRRKFLAF